MGEEVAGTSWCIREVEVDVRVEVTVEVNGR